MRCKKEDAGKERKVIRIKRRTELQGSREEK
jgi:hypothetical protein